MEFLNERFEVDPGRTDWRYPAVTFGQRFRAWTRARGLPRLSRSGIAFHLRAIGIRAVLVDGTRWHLTGLLERPRARPEPIPKISALAFTRSQVTRWLATRPFPLGAVVTPGEAFKLYSDWVATPEAGVRVHHRLGQRTFLERLMTLGVRLDPWTAPALAPVADPAPSPRPAPTLAPTDGEEDPLVYFLRNLGAL